MNVQKQVNMKKKAQLEFSEIKKYCPWEELG